MKLSGGRQGSILRISSDTSEPAKLMPKEYVLGLRTFLGVAEELRQQSVKSVKSKISRLKEELDELKGRKREIISELQSTKKDILFKKKSALGEAIAVEQKFEERNEELVIVDADIMGTRERLEDLRHILKCPAEKYKKLWQAKDDIKKMSFDKWYKKHECLITQEVMDEIEDRYALSEAELWRRRKEREGYMGLDISEWKDEKVGKVYDEITSRRVPIEDLLK